MDSPLFARFPPGRNDCGRPPLSQRARRCVHRRRRRSKRAWSQPPSATMVSASRARAVFNGGSSTWSYRRRRSAESPTFGDQLRSHVALSPSPVTVGGTGGHDVGGSGSGPEKQVPRSRFAAAAQPQRNRLGSTSTTTTTEFSHRRNQEEQSCKSIQRSPLPPPQASTANGSRPPTRLASRDQSRPKPARRCLPTCVGT